MKSYFPVQIQDQVAAFCKRRKSKLDRQASGQVYSSRHGVASTTRLEQYQELLQTRILLLRLKKQTESFQHDQAASK